MYAGSQIVSTCFPGSFATGSLYQARTGGTMKEAATAPATAPTSMKTRTVFTAPVCHGRAAEGKRSARQPPRDARRERHDRDLRVHADAGREEARVGDVEAGDAAHRTPAVGDASPRVAPHARRPHGMKPRGLERRGTEAALAQRRRLAGVRELGHPRHARVDALRPRGEEDLR